MKKLFSLGLTFSLLVPLTSINATPSIQSVGKVLKISGIILTTLSVMAFGNSFIQQYCGQFFEILV
jgi:hypothetical protein